MIRQQTVLSYLTLAVRTKCIKCTASCLAVDEPGKPAAPPNSALSAVLTRLWTGVKRECDLSSMWPPRACSGHLITWGLDTALISDLRHCQVERWSLGGDLGQGCPGKPAGAGLELALEGGLDLARLSCPARETYLDLLLGTASTWPSSPA